MRRFATAVLALAAAGCSGGPAASAPPQVALRHSLTFYAGFDGGVNAVYAPGDPALYTAPGGSFKDAKPGLPAEAVTLAIGQGRYGDALRFEEKTKNVLFFKGGPNVSWSQGQFAGTVSFWLSLDPERDLEPGYCDPFQLTDKKWDDACLFADFSKDEVPRLFRLGVFSDYREWNPQGRKWDLVPAGERPFVAVERPPFERGKWTHVAFTFQGFNTGREDAVARLYLNGDLQGELSGKRTFTWDPSKVAIVIGVSYVGLFDELSIFNRALTPEEIRELGRLENGIASLVPSRAASR